MPAMSSRMAATISGWTAGWRRSSCFAARDLQPFSKPCRETANESGPAQPRQDNAARPGKRGGRRHRFISRATPGCCDARDHDRDRRDQRVGQRQRKPAGLARPPQGPRRPHHDQPEPVHRRRKTARGFHPRTFVAARDDRLDGSAPAGRAHKAAAPAK